MEAAAEVLQTTGAGRGCGGGGQEGGGQLRYYGQQVGGGEGGEGSVWMRWGREGRGS